MQDKKQYPPSSFCVKCGKYGTDSQINKKCYSCGGIFTSAEAPNDWKPCPYCNQYGYIDGKTCLDCQSKGWILIRK